MESRQLYRFQSVRRVPQYLDAHDDILSAVNRSDLRKQLDAVVAQVEPATTEQDASQRTLRGELNNQRSLERTLKRDHMGPLAKYARAELDGVPNLAALTPAVKKLKGDKLVNAARALAKAAAPYAAQLEAGHFPADCLAQLGAAADAVEASIKARSARKLQRVNATKDIETAIDSGRALVKRIDARISRLIAHDPALVEEWRVAMRVAKKPGVPRGSAAKSGASAPATGPALVPSTTPASAPAKEVTQAA
jgi:hypothetical protein